MEAIELDAAIFSMQAKIFVGPFDEDQFNDFLKEKDANPEEVSKPTGQGCCWDCGHNQIIWVEVSPTIDPVKFYGILAHEAVHAAFHSADSIGFDSHYGSQEFHAYYTQWILTETANKLVDVKE